ncbi:28S ribosomal protein S17, mitochondrial-like [Ochotona curzoniae]|uniref:28S ribosomal protein S17, mitochondrial-like n=1 Tax=Ochotona curzoniae TaxID=130825 RepID=UPI001B34638E|nr:28S ribosomal protein S17, mitochondrial-like [Ochotona curzoniae]
MLVIRLSVHGRWVVGKVIGTAMPKIAEVRVAALMLGPCLLKYFSKRQTYFAHDALEQCMVGDTVLLKGLPVPETKHVKHELAEIIFKVGRVVDPGTGNPCVCTAYLESPLSVETIHLTQSLEELQISTPGSRIGRRSKRERLIHLPCGSLPQNLKANGKDSTSSCLYGGKKDRAPRPLDG